MSRVHSRGLAFDKQIVHAAFLSPDGKAVRKRIEIRTNPITGRTARISYSRSDQYEPGTESLPPPPPDAEDNSGCPFCEPRVEETTPRTQPAIWSDGRLRRNDSLLFPNLFPYGMYSAVSLFDQKHFVEIGKASVESYRDCLVNCGQYLRRVLDRDPRSVFMAVTQNHLPSAGGSLVHPHLQIHADPIASNHHRFLYERAREYRKQAGGLIFSDYLAHEKKDNARYVGKTGDWEWMAAFAPEGFYELWGLLPGRFFLTRLDESDWFHLAEGVINAQKFFRSLNRNGYNLGVLSVEDEQNRCLELRCVIIVRSNYAAWVRNDHTGFELMLGDMTTFSSPEETALSAKPFWN